MRPASGRWRSAAALWALWQGVGLAFGLQSLIVHQAIFEGRIEWWRPFLTNFLCYHFWWLLTPLVLHLGRRFPLERGWRERLLHLGTGLALPALYLVLCQVFVFGWLRPDAYQPETLGSQFVFTLVANLHLEVLTYWVVVGVQLSLRVLRERQREELRAARLAGHLTEARLLALRMQLQPHFLFNTLNGISALIHEDPEAADTMLVRLAEFLRVGLEAAGRPEVTLAEERAFLGRYLEIEAIRFPDRLRVDIEVDEALGRALVPSLILQPLVENAIRHGIARREEPGRIGVSGASTSEGLRLVVHNDGPPLPAGYHEGIGLGNCRARLLEMYGRAARLEVGNDPGGGVKAELLLPLRFAPAPAELA